MTAKARPGQSSNGQTTASSELPTILCVDDDQVNLRAFQGNFGKHFHIICCQSPGAALEQLAQLTDVAVVVADQKMPEMTGVELLERVRQTHPDTQRMVLTAYSELDIILDALNRAGAHRYFVKPWKPEELLGALMDSVRIYTLQGQLRQMEQRMRHSERLMVIGQVSTSVAHELTNPVGYVVQNIDVLRSELAVLTGYVEPRLARDPDPAVQRTLEELPRVLSDMESGATHIRQVAQGLKAHVRGDNSERTCDLADVVGFASRLALGGGRRLARLAMDEHHLRVHGSPVSLCQVLLNLIVNAGHSLESLGRPGLIEVRWKAEGERVRLQVKDNGCGIPPELHEKVFEPFFTTKPAGQGTGLGLSICRELVQKMGGEMRLESTVGRGTVMEVLLLRAPDEAKANEKPRAAS